MAKKLVVIVASAAESDWMKREKRTLWGTRERDLLERLIHTRKHGVQTHPTRDHPNAKRPSSQREDFL